MHIAVNRAHAVQSAVDMYRHFRDADLRAEDVPVVLDGSNREVDTVNRLLQRVREERGEIDGAGYDVRSTETGRRWTLHDEDRVIFLEPCEATTWITVVPPEPRPPRYVKRDQFGPLPPPPPREPEHKQVPRKVRNGETGVIVEIDFEHDLAVVAMDRGDVVTVALEGETARQPLGLAYGVHIAKYQGGQAPIVIALPSTRPIASQNSGYTQLTRAELEAHVIVDYETHGDKPIERLAEAWSEPRQKRTALSQLDPEVAEAIRSHVDARTGQSDAERDREREAQAEREGTDSPEETPAGQTPAAPVPSASAADTEPKPEPVAMGRDGDETRDDARADDGAAAEALAALDEAGRVQIAESRVDALQRAVEAYREHRDAGRADDDIAIVVDGSDREVDAVNELVQRVREDLGDIAADAGYDIRTTGRERNWTLHDDDRIVFLRTYDRDAERADDEHQREVREGETGVIVAVNFERDLAVVDMDNGDVVTVDLEKETAAPLIGLADDASDREHDERGEIAEAGYTIRATGAEREWTLHEHDRAVFLRTYDRDAAMSAGADDERQRQVREGETGVIAGIDSEHELAVVALDSGDVVTVHLEKETAAPALGLAYAVHASDYRGDDTPVAIVLPCASDSAQHSAFTELPRADVDTYVIVDTETHGANPVDALVRAWSPPPSPDPEPEHTAAPERGPEPRQELPREPDISAGTSEPSRVERARDFELVPPEQPAAEADEELAEREAQELLTSSVDLYRAAEAAQRPVDAGQSQESPARAPDARDAQRAEQGAVIRHLEDERKKRLDRLPTLDPEKVWPELTIAEEHAAKTDPEIQQPQTTAQRDRTRRGLSEEDEREARIEELRNELAEIEAAERAAAARAEDERQQTMRGT